MPKFVNAIYHISKQKREYGERQLKGDVRSIKET